MVEGLALSAHERLLDCGAVRLCVIRDYRVSGGHLRGFGLLAGHRLLFYTDELVVSLVLVHQEPAAEAAELVRGGRMAELFVEVTGVEGKRVEDLGLEARPSMMLVLRGKRYRVHEPVGVVALEVLGVRVEGHEGRPHPV